MAGSISDDSVIWVAGEATGKDEAGAAATVATAVPDSLLSAVTFAAGAPSGAPAANKGPLYVNTSTNKLSAWNGSAWIAASGFNT